MKKEKNCIEECINRIIEPIFKKVLQETPKNPLSVGHPPKKIKKFCIYQPHNYRLYLDFNKANLNLSKLRQTHLKRRVFATYRLQNYKEHILDDFMGCRITIKKTQVEILNKINSGKQYIINIDTRARQKFKKIVNQKNRQCIRVLKKFMGLYGGSSNFDILNVWSENAIMNEDIIDLLPIKMRWHTKISKKVYDAKKVEFYDPALASNYINSRAVEDIAPSIAKSIRTLDERLAPAINNLAITNQLLTKQVNLHLGVQETTKDVLKGIEAAFNRFNSQLSKNEKKPIKTHRKHKYGLSKEEIDKMKGYS